MPLLGALGPPWPGGIKKAGAGIKKAGASIKKAGAGIKKAGHLGAILGPINNKIEIQTPRGKSVETFWVDFGAPNGSQNDPKTTPK